MAATDDSGGGGGGGGGGSSAFWGRPFLSLRRSQVAAMEPGQEQDLHDLDLFQSHVADRLAALLPGPATPRGQQDKKDPQGEPFLSLAFLAKLLDALLSIEEEFRALLLARNPTLLSKLPLDRLLNDLLDRAVKSLDVCNAVSLALHSLRHWHRHALIAAAALRAGHGRQLSRARRALSRLLSSTPLDPYHSGSPPAASAAAAAGGRAEKAWSFGRSGGGEGGPTTRSPSWCVSRTWSAARQVQAMSAHLTSPRGEFGVGGAAAAGMAMAVYTMSSVMVFAMWVLVAAVPCQERGGPAPGPVAAPPRHLQWAATVTILQDRIAEEWRRREKKGAGWGSHHQSPPAVAGLLAELQAVERCGRALMEESSGGTPKAAGEAAEATAAAELAEACQRLEEGLGPFERQVREVFHRVVRSRAEVLRCLDLSTRSAPPDLV